MSDTPGSPPSYNVALIREDMAVRGWLRTHLAREAGLSDMTVIRFLGGGAQTAPTALKIATALGHDVRRYLVPVAERVAS